MATWADWIPDVAPEAPGAPEPSIEDAVRNAVIEFCQRSRWLVRTVPNIDHPGGATAQSFATRLPLAAGERVIEVQEARWYGKEIPRLTPLELDAEYGVWDFQSRTGEPRALVQEREDEYWISPAPSTSQTDALQLRVVIGYGPAALACDDAIRNRWREAIACGALGRLLVQKDQPWTDPTLGATKYGMFEEAIASAKTAAVRGPTKKRLEVRPVFY